MIRRWHRWLALVFGAFILWIATTGVLSQIGALVNKGGFEREGPRLPPVIPPAKAHELPDAAPAAQPVTATAFKCPETMVCRPKPAPAAWNVGLLHRIHSGEQFGPAGVIVSILSGLTLIFFAVSGMVMYVNMFSARTRRTRQTGGKWFWR
ncbi:MAG: PepSY-associated TM helix domain-containing protein [Sphingomicrobium sp.]